MTTPSPDVDYVLAKLAEIQRLIAVPDTSPVRYVTAFDNAPDVVQSTDLPAFVNLPGPMTPDPVGSEDRYAEFIETRLYYCTLLIAPLGSGISGEAYGLATPWFAIVRNQLAAYQGLKSNALRTQFQGDGGVRGDIQYAGTFFYGIRFTLAVSGRSKVRYAGGE